MPADWLSLSETAEILGVHPSTVRNWSNQGVFPVHRTQGGHRRYLRNEIEVWMQTHKTEGSNEFHRITQNTLKNTRFQIGEGGLNEEAWYLKLDEEAREQYRQSGRAMLQGMLNFINNETSAQAEAETLGYEYALRGWRYGLNSVDATHAFLFFRQVLMESLLFVFETTAVHSATTWSEMYHKITTFTDNILITMLETYEVYYRGSR
jgi:excisionase family DNA binding protein